MLKVGIIQLEQHTEVARALIRALEAVYIEPILFLSKEVHGDLHETGEISTYDVAIWQKGQSCNAFFYAHETQLKSCDALICTSEKTVDGMFVSFRWPCTSYLVLHDLHTSFVPFQHFNVLHGFPNSFFQYLRLAKYILLRKGEERQRAMESFDHYLLPSEEMYQYVSTQPWFDDKITSYLPIACHDACALPNFRQEEIVISIPGSITPKRKDLDIVLKALSKISLRTNRKLRVQFLGKAIDKNGIKWTEELMKLNSPQMSIQVFEKYISQLEFDFYLHQSDFLILPISLHKADLFNELYGFSAVSGNINDMTRCGIPALISASYPIPLTWQGTICKQYADEVELANLVIQWVETQEYQKIKKEASQVLHPFEMDEIGNRIKKLLFHI